MHQFIQRHADSVSGVLSGFDRIRFRGTLRILANSRGLWSILCQMGILLKDFRQYALGVTAQVRQASEAVAREQGRPVHYLNNSHESKEEWARHFAERERIREGLICVLSAVEMCRSFQVQGDRKTKKLDLVSRPTKCIHLYHYYLHPDFGLIHVRIQTWFPFNIFICLNGREWLARQMDRVGIDYVKADNCFSKVSDVEQAQELLNEQVRVNWSSVLGDLTHQAHPAHQQIFARLAFPLQYYWSADESEWATDILFRSPNQLALLYPQLVRFSMENLQSRDVLRFLGRAHPGLSEVTSDMKRRTQGIRVKHSVGHNSVKMYDKFGSVLRVETTINNTRELKVPRKTATGKLRWKHMAKGVQDLHYRTQASQAINERYLQALGAADCSIALDKLVGPICQPRRYKGRQVRALRPLDPWDSGLLDAVSCGEFLIHGFRNRDLAAVLFGSEEVDAVERRRRQSAVSRKLRLLRAHGLIRKSPHSYRYQLTRKGRLVISTLQSARAATLQQLTKVA